MNSTPVAKKHVTARRPEWKPQRKLTSALVSGVTRATSVTNTTATVVERNLTQQLSPPSEIPRGTAGERTCGDKTLDLADKLANWEAKNDKEREANVTGKCIGCCF